MSTPLQVRQQGGRALRNECARKEHTRQAQRDPVDLLKQSSQGRLPSLVPLRSGRLHAQTEADFAQDLRV